MNEASYLKWQNKQHKQPKLGKLLKLVGVYSVILYIAVVVLLLFQKGGWRMIIAIALSQFIYRIIFSESIRLFIKQERPYQQYGFHPVNSVLFSREHKRFDSFPSDHTGMLVSMSVILWTWNPPLGFLGILGALCVGSARVLMGYHHPKDVTGGAVLGLFAGILGAAISIALKLLPM